MTSIIHDEVNEGSWGANGAIRYLAAFIQAAEHRILQGLAASIVTA